MVRYKSQVFGVGDILVRTWTLFWEIILGFYELFLLNFVFYDLDWDFIELMVLFYEVQLFLIPKPGFRLGFPPHSCGFIPILKLFNFQRDPIPMHITTLLLFIDHKRLHNFFFINFMAILLPNEIRVVIIWRLGIFEGNFSAIDDGLRLFGHCGFLFVC